MILKRLFRNYGGKFWIYGSGIEFESRYVLKEGRTPNGVRIGVLTGLRSTELCTPNGVQKHRKSAKNSILILLCSV